MSAEERLKRISSNIKKERIKRGLTQQQLAFMANCSIAVVRRYEQCQFTRPQVSTLTRFAGALGISIDKFYD